MAIRKINSRSIEDSAIAAADVAAGSITTAKIASSVTLTTPTIDTITSAAATALTLKSAGTTAITVSTGQLVGVGTASPTNTLQVAGGISATSSAPAFQASAAIMDVSAGVARFNATGADSSTYGVMTFNRGSSNAGLFQESMRISAAGNVGIATTSPTSSLEIYRANSSTGSLTDTSLLLSTSATTGRKVNIGFGLGGGVANTCAAVIGYDVISGTGAGYGDIFFSTRSTTADSVPSERMRVTNDGTIRIGMQNFAAAVSSSNFGMSLNNTNAGSYSYAYSTTTNTHWGFGNGNGGTGSIQTNGSTTSFNTTSDHRLKQNVVPMTGGLARVQALKPVTYKWKVDGADGEGFIAHELQEVCSHAVTGEKDAVDENGDPVYQQVDTSFLVATLTAAIQELKVENDALKARLDAAGL